MSAMFGLQPPGLLRLAVSMRRSQSEPGKPIAKENRVCIYPESVMTCT